MKLSFQLDLHISFSFSFIVQLNDILIQYKLNDVIPEINKIIPGYVMKDFDEKFISFKDVQKKSLL